MQPINFTPLQHTPDAEKCWANNLRYGVKSVSTFVMIEKLCEIKSDTIVNYLFMSLHYMSEDPTKF